MRALVVTLAAALLGFGAAVTPAQAEPLGFELNGSYRVTSNGEWAKTNEVYMDEATVVSVWTISSSCENAHVCTGQVSSDQGWTAPLEFRSTRWIVDRYHENWQTCPDGTTSPGRQRYQFQGSDNNGQYTKANTDLLVGYDRTIGISGACGRNQPTVILLPLTLVRL
ncbi:hypothetical protein [Mycobacterium talmoniae]|uniref:Secreted protein n=1 Tax=Mycobacterium talmoniae TaxID=1858794 RepID=A0A1S1NNI0_9MYCO|nr:MULTISPECIES: hypothetical protein [Mycobacterium]OHV06428.1 hypothetical protein BKN37_02320 [Mycobacterium talmoniae]PQM44552.1 hypothetical protein C1Y40_05292 [Mycobacterium talmoniae]